jgi:hypothetical protein
MQQTKQQFELNEKKKKLAFVASKFDASMH